jgi:uncharacterized protein
LNSSPDNPQFSQTEASTPAPASDVPLAAQLPPAAPRDPVWNGLDVLRIVLMEIVLFFSIIIALIIVLPAVTFKEKIIRLGNSPELPIGAQVLSYVFLLGYMYILVKKERGSPTFWKAIHWNWPAKTWLYLAVGVVLQVIVLFSARFVSLPKETPFDALLRRPSTVFLIAAFAPTLGAVMEELFFRGFFYPVLVHGFESLVAYSVKVISKRTRLESFVPMGTLGLRDPVRTRRYAVLAGITISAVAFGLLHAPEYSYSLPLVSLLTMIGIVLGIIRAAKDSVAAAVLVHAAYNGTIILMLAIATDGFRHLEKLNQ